MCIPLVATRIMLSYRGSIQYVKRKYWKFDMWIVTGVLGHWFLIWFRWRVANLLVTRLMCGLVAWVNTVWTFMQVVVNYLKKSMTCKNVDFYTASGKYRVWLMVTSLCCQTRGVCYRVCANAVYQALKGRGMFCRTSGYEMLFTFLSLLHNWFHEIL